MSVQIARPPVGELMFQLFDRPLHPELFDILAVRTVDQDPHRFDVWITRTGHAITWSDGKQFLTEVAATWDAPLPDSSLLRHRLRGERYGAVTLGQTRYQASFQVESLPPEIFLHVHDEILADGAKRGLLHNFQPDHRLALAPLGFVTLDANARCFSINTFHTFPDEFTVVKTQTLIEPAP